MQTKKVEAAAKGLGKFIKIVFVFFALGFAGILGLVTIEEANAQQAKQIRARRRLLKKSAKSR